MDRLARAVLSVVLALLVGVACGDSSPGTPDGQSGRDGGGDAPRLDDGGGGSDGDSARRDLGGSDGDGGAGADAGDGGADAFTQRHAQPNTAWSSAPFRGSDVEVVKLAIAPTSGDIVALLRFSGDLLIETESFSAEGPMDAAIARFDAAGKLKWARQIGGTGDKRMFDVVVDGNERSYVVGQYNGQLIAGTVSLISAGTDGILLTYTQNGANSIAKHVDTASGTSVIRAVAVDANNNFIIAGELDSTASVGPTTLQPAGGGGDIYVVKFDGTSTLTLKQRVIGGAKADAYPRLTMLSGGELLLTGESSESFSVDGKSVTVSSAPDLFAIKLDSDLSAKWAQSIVGKAAGKRDDVIADVIVSASGRILMCGRYGEQLDIGTTTLKKAAAAQTSDGWLAAFDPQNGAPAYAVRFGGDAAGDQGCSALGVASAAHVVVFAHVQGNATLAGKSVSDADGQLALRMTPATGGFDGVFAYAGDLQVNDAVWDSAGIVAGGRFEGALKLGGKSISSKSGGPDGLLWRLTLP